MLLERTALAAYGGRILAAVLIAAFYLRWIRRNLSFSRAAVDFGEFGDALRYGMPLVLNEIAGVALISIDRFMSASLSESFVPVANRLYETGGAAQVQSMKQRILLPLTYVSLGVAVAVWTIGSDALHAISGSDKYASGPVFAWIGTLYALYPLADICGYGLLLRKRTVTVLNLTIAATAVNVALNLYLIPRYSYMGAVYATSVAYALLGISICVLCPRELFRLPDTRSLATAGGAAAVFLVVVHQTGLFGLGLGWPRLFGAGALWALLYLLPVLLLDGRLRAMLLAWYRARRGPAATVI